MRSHRIALFIGAALLASAAGRALAQTAATHAFTYQGVLQNGGVNAAGAYDFQFKLFNAATAGTQVGSTQSASSVQVVGGLVNMPLNFGPVYSGVRLWLDVSVRATGGGGYTTLLPRQELTGAPYAQGLALPLAASSPALTPLMITSTSLNGSGVIGECDNGTSAYGLWGISQTGVGVVGSGFGSAVGGSFTSSSNTAILALSDAVGDNAAAISAVLTDAGAGENAAAVHGTNGATSQYGYGVWGTHNGAGIGVYGSTLGTGYGVLGECVTNTPFGMQGTGVRGNGGDTGVYGYGQTGVFGSTTSGGAIGVFGSSSDGGGSSMGVRGFSFDSSGNGVVGEANTGTHPYGVWGKTTVSTGYAGFFNGNGNIVGNITKSGGAFRIDHPLDPANKYLQHSFVESPDMKNIYDGVTTTDGRGYATILLPDWFGALNSDFRYQLTVIDGADSDDFVQAKVVRELQDNQFTVRTSRAGTRVSWQVTGIRQDPWAKAHPIVTELEKTGLERGHVLIPEAYGMPESASMDHVKEMAPMPAALRRRAGPDTAQSSVPAPAITPVKQVEP